MNVKMAIVETLEEMYLIVDELNNHIRIHNL